MSGWDGPRSARGSADELIDAFGRWAAEQRAGDAAEARSRERWLRQQASESANLAGTLVDLAERRAGVALDVGARTVTGRLVGVGRDGCVVSEPSGAATVVPLDRIVTVRTTGQRPGTGEATGGRRPSGTWTVADALAALAAERSPVRLGLTGGENLAGVLVAVGEDILTLQLPAGGTRAIVALSAIETASPT